MAQADGEVANQSGAAVRENLNQQLAAIFTNHSGNNEPSMVPSARQKHQWWYDEQNLILKIRNEANNGWINVIDFNSAAEGALHVPAGTAAATSIRPAADDNSGFFFRQGDSAVNDGYGFGYAMNGTEYLTVQANTTDQSTPDLCWKSTGVSMSVDTASTSGVQFTQSGRVVIQKDAGWVLGLNRTTDYGHIMLFNALGVNKGDITISAGGVAYNTGSDYRLKENVVELTGAKARLQQLPVKRFNFIADPNTTVDGFLAHEAQAVVPEAVTGTHNEVDADGNPVHQGIDQAKLVPLLTAALQEAFAEIAALTARVETLEAG
tara:strand:+ start:5589 stop:6551 length:963 start_codon:yes stop_codon:yes gene_type:complete